MNILLVDDDRESRAYVGEFLRELGHHVVECDNGHAGMESFCAGEFHMVLSDIRMPKISGIELLREISSLPSGKDVDVVLFTGFGDMASAVEALRSGAYDYLLKPINIEELASTTEHIAERQALRRENLVLTQKFEDVIREATEETRQELSRLKEAYYRTVGIGNIVISSEAMKKVFQQAQKLRADRSIPVLIEGETGTGKEVIARYIHYGEGDATASFIDINCAAITPSIFESELFGYEPGAFTGGLVKGQKGKLDLAAGGTVFLDEIGEIPVALQAKLLRVIQEREYFRVGGLRKIKVDARVICATNVDLGKKVGDGTFRQDLYYRLNVGRIHLPPLRQRREDILPLARMFMGQFAREKGKRFGAISREAAEMLLSYQWPGNVRELKNALEMAVLMWDDTELKPSHLGILQNDKRNTAARDSLASRPVDCKDFTLPPGGLALDEYINSIILEALKAHKGNKTQTAKYLGMSRRSLYCRLKGLLGESCDV